MAMFFANKKYITELNIAGEDDNTKPNTTPADDDDPDVATEDPTGGADDTADTDDDPDAATEDPTGGDTADTGDDDPDAATEDPTGGTDDTTNDDPDAATEDPTGGDTADTGDTTTTTDAPAPTTDTGGDENLETNPDNDDTTDDGGEEGGDDTTDDTEGGDEGETDDGEATPEDDPLSEKNLQSMEDDIFSSLSPAEKLIKISELKGSYARLYRSCDEILTKIDSIPKTSENLKILENVTNTLSDLKVYIEHYLTYTFNTHTYIENETNLQKYISIFNAVKEIFKESAKYVDKK